MLAKLFYVANSTDDLKCFTILYFESFKFSVFANYVDVFPWNWIFLKCQKKMNYKRYLYYKRYYKC